MLGNIKNFAYDFFGKIPIVRNFIGKNKREINQESRIIHNKPVEEDNSKNNFESQNIRNICKKINNLIKEVKRDFTINYFPEFKNEIKQCFTKNKNQKEIEFDQNRLINLIETHQNKLINNFKNKIQEINLENKNLENFVVLWRNFITENKKYIEEIQTEIMLQVTENEHSNDLDLISVLMLNKEISKKISTNTLQKLASEINNISIKNQEEKDQLKKRFNDVFETDYQQFFIGSQFGIQPKNIVDIINSNIELDKSKEDKDFFYNLELKTKFQNATVGNFLYEANVTNESSNNIGILDPNSIKIIFERLSDRYFDYVNLRNNFIKKPEYDARKSKITNEINDIKEYLYQSGLTENTLSYEIKNLKNNEFLEKLEIDSNKFITNIKNLYNKKIWMSNYLGTLQKENIAGNEFESKQIIELFNKKNEEKIDQLKRILLEVSCLACIEVILKNLGLIDPNTDLSQTKKNKFDQNLPAIENFNSIPWLKDYYQQKIELYKQKVQNEDSSFKIGVVINELSKIGKELHRSKFFSSSDFFSRYGLYKEGDLLNNLIGKMTNIGRMSLNLGFVSHFLASIDPEENQDIDPNLISNIDSLINYLAKISKVYDSKGKEVFSPNKTEEYIEQAYSKLSGIIGSRDFLAFNTPLIVNFLRKTFGKDLPDDVPIPKDSFYSKNQVLSTWLFYTLVKFLPEKSDDQESLKARILIFDQIIDESFQKKARFTSELYRKIIRKARGLDDDDKPSKTSHGVIKGLCIDLERLVQDHMQNKKLNLVNLQFILNEYSKIEDKIKQNPKSISKALNNQSKVSILTPLENYLFNLFEQKPLEIIKFVKEKENTKPNYKNTLCLDILDDICTKIKKLNFGSNHIVILDSEEKKIKETIDVLERLMFLGFLLNTLNQDTIKFSSEHFKTNDNYKNDLESKISLITSFINSQVTLVVDEKFSPELELFKDQYEYKIKLKQLLSKTYLGFRPANGKNINWVQQSKVLQA